VVALTGQLAAWLTEHPSVARVGAVAAWVVIVAAVSLAGGRIPPLPAQESVALGWVQGGAPGGDVLNPGPARVITTSQATQTEKLADEVDAGRQPEPDLVVWPESSTDLDPDADAPTRALVDDALRRVGRPILVGSVIQGPEPGQRRTVAQWWTPGGNTPRPTYVKRSIVPFGEWIPYRDILLPLFPVLGYVGPQSVAGTQPGLLTVQVDGRPVVLGVLICFDVAFDPVAYDLAPAQLLIVQSNNAMYQGSAQLEQQFAITRARAAELRREVLVVTTSGVSGLIDPYGKPTFREDGPGSARGVVTIPERTGATLATTLAGLLDRAVTLLALTWLSVLALVSLQSGRSARAVRSARIIDHR
jgi:apolipoprotein N-acyltransferase